MIRILAALVALCTIGTIGGYTYWTLPQGRMIPGFARSFLIFAAGLALPCLVTVVPLARSDGRDGLRFALGETSACRPAGG